ncbi:MAG TPA: RNA-binding domain-containing protein [Polyangiaceae bacterium]|nr:RNA-binding domain-containing protein [Polyangiaceae bacterium]
MPTLHDDYMALDFPMLERWKAEAKQESLHLDFKRWGKPFSSGTFAQAASAFANAEGGIIVWGVDCRKDKHGVDSVDKFVPIENVDAALTTLKEHSSQVLSPGLSGIDHRILHREPDGTGFVATFVPASDAAPHMAGFGDRYYFKRNSTASLRMEHYEIADMFGKRQRPDLFVTLTCHKHEISSNLHLYQLEAGLRNRGRVMARFLRVYIEMPNGIMGWPGYQAPTVRNFNYVRTTEPVFPGELTLLPCHGAQYHMNDELFDRFQENGWPNVVIQIYQEHAPMIEVQKPFVELQNF